MKSRGFVILVSLLVFLLGVNLACSFSADTPAAVPTPTREVVIPTQSNPNPPEATQPPPIEPNTQGGWHDFTDENNLYTIRVPGNWGYKQERGDNYYIDLFKSPDEQALVESIVYDDGTPFTGGQNGKFALKLLNEFYSNTGDVGDIRVIGDQIQPDGSERLEWTSKSGGYSGYSYFEVRNKTTFLMITIEWVDSVKDNYIDTLNQIIESYTIP